MILYVGHGTFFNHEGPIAEVTLEHLTRTQADHMRQLEAYAKERGIQLAPSTPAQEGDILARSAQIEQLIDQLEPPNQAWLQQVNAAVRIHYTRYFL